MCSVSLYLHVLATGKFNYGIYIFRRNRTFKKTGTLHHETTFALQTFYLSTFYTKTTRGRDYDIQDTTLPIVLLRVLMYIGVCAV